MNTVIISTEPDKTAEKAADKQREGLEKRSRELVISITNDIEQLPVRKNRNKRTMFRVRPRLKAIRPEMYNPELISLGLFDRLSFAKTKADKVRSEVAKAFMETMNMTLDTLRDLVVPDPKQTEDLYEAEEHDNLLPEGVQYLLALDAIFVACFLGVWSCEKFRHQFPLFNQAIKDAGIDFINMIFIDILKLENQIPLSLITNVFLVLYKETENPEPKMTENTRNRICAEVAFCHSISGFNKRPPAESISNVNFAICVHLLHCAYLGMCGGAAESGGNGGGDNLNNENNDDVREQLPLISPTVPPAPAAPTTPSSSSPQAPEDSLRKFSRWLTQLFGRARNRCPATAATTNAADPLPCLPSATQLHDAGIYIRGHPAVFSNVKFDKGWIRAQIYIPTLRLSDSTLSMWRNLLAFEMTQPDPREGESSKLATTQPGPREGESSKLATTQPGPPDKEFSAFLSFMDNLIESDKDVSILRKGKHPVIIENDLGGDVAVAAMFHEVLLECFIINQPLKWNKLQRDICHFYNRKYRRMFVEFFTKYFDKPWKIKWQITYHFKNNLKRIFVLLLGTLCSIWVEYISTWNRGFVTIIGTYFWRSLLYVMKLILKVGISLQGEE